MPKRLAIATALIALFILALPAGASAAESPWWQVLDGSRPSNLWEPTDSVQEIDATTEFDAVVQMLEVGGNPIGCLGTANELGEQGCLFFVGSELPPGVEPTPISTAEQLKTVLEPIYGPTVEVSGGPVGAAPLIVTVPGVAVPTIGGLMTKKEAEEKEKGRFGDATNKVLSNGGSGRLVVTLTNLGDKELDATATPVRIVDELPEGMVASGVEASAGARGRSGPVDCELETSTKVACKFEGTLPSYESIEIEVLANTTGEPPVLGEPGHIGVSGGNAPPETGPQEVTFSPEKTPFGVERFSGYGEEEGGKESRHAGSHPFQVTTTLQANAGVLKPGPTRGENSTEQPAQPRNLRFTLPEGVVGNTTAVPRCQMSDFWDGSTRIFTNQCPDETAVGVAAVTIVEKTNIGFTRIEVPLFNLEPVAGEPARLGFTVVGTPVLIDTEVDPDNDYRIVGEVRNATQVAQFLSSTVTIWGTPGDPAHDGERGWVCGSHFFEIGECQNPPGANEDAFLRLPVSCTSPSENRVELEPWNVPLGSVIAGKDFSSPPLEGCNEVPLNPEISAASTSKLASNPTGLEFGLDMPNSGLPNPDATAEGQAKKVEVTLPEGMTLNPSAADGLGVCSPQDYGRERFDSKPGEGCPEASKLGEVKIKTPLLKEEARGALYAAKPYDNPFDSLLAVYLVAKIPERGILVKQAGVVRPDPNTGQLVTTFDDLPQLPFSSFKLRFREGGRAPLITPPACGTYETVAKFTPWSATDPNNPTPDEIVTETSSFQIERGVDGGACPKGGTPPFGPGFEAGSLNSSAGRYSPFYMRLTRADGEQDLTKFSATLPAGALAKLAGVTRCSQAAIDAAESKTGIQERESPSCPASSQIGHTKVGAGAGALQTWVPGNLYLAGPYKGAPLSVAAITPAVAGPFDVGTVVVQEGLKLDPRTAEVHVDGNSSEPIPHILAGIPLKVRDLRVYVDRAQFTTTPTSCDPMATTAELFGSGLDVFSLADDKPIELSARYQASDCASLGFKPSLKLKLKGGTKRGDHPALTATYRPRKGDANLSALLTRLPRSAFLDQAHIRTICTRVQFAAESCPKAAQYGFIKAWTPLLDEPLQGPVWLRSSNHKLPDLVFDLHGLVDVEVATRIDSVKGGIRANVEDSPDAPLTKVELKMQGGRKGLIINSRNLCGALSKASVEFSGHNGKQASGRPKLEPQCGAKRKSKR